METPKDFRNQEKRLYNRLVSLIAEHDHIEPSEVTMHYILNRREKHIYPEKRFDKGSKYGGYDDFGLYVFTDNELKKIEDLSDQFLESYS